MQPTDFSKYLTSFLTKYLPAERGASTNTITAYRDSFVLLIKYMESAGTKVNKITLAKLDRKTVLAFLEWLQKERGASVGTRNMRLSAIHSFFKYLQYQHPEHLQLYQDVLAIPIKKKQSTPMNYLSIEGIKLLLQQIDLKTSTGLRDLAMLSLMYDTAARVQEVIDLTPSSIRLDKPATVKIKGKGNKTRIVPMLDDQVQILKEYMNKYHLTESASNMYPLFSNRRSEKLTRAGVSHILMKYIKTAEKQNPKLISSNVSCHSLRHSKAMHLLQAGVNLVYIRDILGHVSVTTTEVYARVDSKKKREAIESAYTKTAPTESGLWQVNDNLLAWLQSL
jgi:site-specific recombinase XerD